MLWRVTGSCCFDSHGRPDEESRIFSRNVGTPLWNYNTGVASQQQAVFIFTVISALVFKILLLLSYSSLDGFKLLNIILHCWSFYSQNLGNTSRFHLMCLLIVAACMTLLTCISGLSYVYINTCIWMQKMSAVYKADCTHLWPMPMAARSLACWDCGFKS